MNDVLPPTRDPSDDDVDALYRRAAARDPSRPSAWVRQSVLDRAAQVAAGWAPARELTLPGELSNEAKDPVRRARKRPAWWRPAVFGTLAAAALAGLLVLPHVLTPHVFLAASDSQARISPPALIPSAATSFAPAAPSPIPSRPTAAESESLPSPAPSPRRDAFAKRSDSTPVPPPAAARVPASPPALATRGQINPAATMEAASKRVASTGSAVPAARPSEPSPEPDLAFNPTPPPGYESITVEAHRREHDQAEPALASTVTPSSADEATTLQEVVVADSHPGLHQAAEKGDLRALQSLLRDQHSDINSRDNAGRTALLLATLRGQTKAVKLLLAYGADPNIADADGVTPLRAANGHSAIAAALKRAGAH